MSAPAEAGSGTGAPATIPELDLLRARLDRIDESLLNNLRERIACCVDIADLKRQHSVPVMQPDRVRVVLQRTASFAAETGIDEDFLHRVYVLIIEEACRVQDMVMRGLPVGSSAPPAALAQSYGRHPVLEHFVEAVGSKP